MLGEVDLDSMMGEVDLDSMTEEVDLGFGQVVVPDN
jgi:hypothetical protein